MMRRRQNLHVAIRLTVVCSNTVFSNSAQITPVSLVQNRNVWLLTVFNHSTRLTTVIFMAAVVFGYDGVALVVEW